MHIHIHRLLLTLFVLLAAGSADAKHAKPQLCPDARWVVTAGRDLIADTASTTELVLAGGHLRFDAACAPTSAQAKASKKGMQVTVRWKACDDVRKIVLTARASRDCASIAGSIKAKKHKPTAFTAAKSRCGDQVVDGGGGEQCDGGACPGGGTCSDTCTCVPAAVAQVTGRITDANGPVAGVTVADLTGTPSGQTNAVGRVTLTLTNGVPHTLRLSKAGYADVVHVVELPFGTAGAYFERSLTTRDPAQPVDGAAGGTVTGRDGAEVVLPANGLVDGGGHPVTGTVQASQTPIDVSGDHLSEFPGDFVGTSGGTTNPIATYGTVEYALEQGGQRLQLAPGKTAVIKYPIYTAQHLDGSPAAVNDTVPFWSLDEQTGKWTQEGVGTIVASATSPTGLALQATVPHFSWWNCDTIAIPPEPFRPKPKCYIDPGNSIPVETECSIGPEPYGVQEVQPATLHTRAIPAGFNRPPNYSVRQFVPIGGVEVEIPADLPIKLRACNFDGTRCATKTVQGASGAVEEVQFLLVPIDTGGNGEHITGPWNQNYAIDPAGEVDLYSFDGQAGDTYAISVTRTANSLLAGTLSLAAPGGVPLDSEHFDRTPAALTITLPQTGSYDLAVDGTAHEPGGYTLRLAKLTALAETPISLPYQNPLTTLLVPTQFDRYVVAATQGQTYGVRMQPAYGGYTGSGTLRARLRDGTELARALFGPSRGTDLLFTSPVTGDVVIELGTQETGPQPYALGVFPLTLGTDEAVTVPFARTDQITAAVHRYRITTDGPRILRTYPTGLLNPYLLVLAGDKTIDTATYYGSCNHPLTTDLPAAGEYVLGVHCGYLCGANLPTMPLQLVYASELVPGTPATATIAHANDLASFTVEVVKDKPYWMGVYSDTDATSLYLQVTDDVGEPAHGFPQTYQPGVPTFTGRHTIDVRRASGATGVFTTSVLAIASPTAVAFAGTVATKTDVLDVPGRQLYYTVDLVAGDKVVLALDTPVPGGSTGLGGTAELIFPANVATAFWSPNVTAATVRTNFGGTNANSGHAQSNVYTVPTTGTWVVGVFHEGQWLGNATGAFTWTLTKQ